MRNQLLFLLGFPCDNSFLSCCFQDFLPIFRFQYFHYDESVCGSLSFILLGVPWVSWLCRLFFNIWEYFSYNFKKMFLSLFSHSSTPIMHMMVHLMMSCIFLRLCSHFLILFSFCSSDCIISIALSSRYFFQFTYCWPPLVNFSFQWLYFPTPELPFGTFQNKFYLFIDILCLVRWYHHTYFYFFNYSFLQFLVF